MVMRPSTDKGWPARCQALRKAYLPLLQQSSTVRQEWGLRSPSPIHTRPLTGSLVQATTAAESSWMRRFCHGQFKLFQPRQPRLTWSFNSWLAHKQVHFNCYQKKNAFFFYALYKPREHIWEPGAIEHLRFASLISQRKTCYAFFTSNKEGCSPTRMCFIISPGYHKDVYFYLQ